MNQRFTIQVVIQYDCWPTKDDVDSGTAEACARSKIQGILDREIPGSVVSGATVVKAISIPTGDLGLPACEGPLGTIDQDGHQLDYCDP